MRIISTKEIIKQVSDLCIKVNTTMPQDVTSSLYKAVYSETSQIGKQILKIFLENIDIASKNHLPICQDTGIAVFFVDIGEDVKITDGSLEYAINEGVRRGYEKGYLRKSVVSCPLRRKNTGDNTPAIIYQNITKGDNITIRFLPKGAGSENVSTIKMFTPATQEKDIINFIVEWVTKNGVNACPPLFVGVGMGGTFEKAALLSKEALLLGANDKNPDPKFANMETEILQRLNASGLGPQGIGGKTTAISVHIKSYACHIACLPVAINIGCCAHRHGEITI